MKKVSNDIYTRHKVVFQAIATFLFFILFAIANAQTYTPPQFKSGQSGFTQFVTSYAKIWALLPDENYAETYTYTLFITRTGAIKFVNVIGKDIEIRAELKRVMKLSDKWQPGLLDGVPVDTNVTGIINICLSLSEKSSCNEMDSDVTVQYYRVPTEFISGVYDRPNTDIYLFNEGRSFFEHKEYLKAIAKFEKAITNNYRPLKEPLFNIGVCYVQLGDNENACKYFLEAARYGDEEAERLYKLNCR